MDLPDLPENTVALFATLCGAIVVMTKSPEAEPAFVFNWSCLGCGDGSRNGNWEWHTIPAANAHAGLCRSVPLPTA